MKLEGADTLGVLSAGGGRHVPCLAPAGRRSARPSPNVECSAELNNNNLPEILLPNKVTVMFILT